MVRVAVAQPGQREGPGWQPASPGPLHFRTGDPAALRAARLIRMNVGFWRSHVLEERRDAHRISKAATGQILFGSAAAHCAILDLSDRGARLELSTTKGLPSNFVLKLTEGNKRECKVVWRDENENRVGVEFC
jgi:hypothetical protein